MNPTRTALAFLLALCVTRVALADPPPTSFTLQFDGDAAIWNPFDGFEACETTTEQGITATLCLSLSDVFCDGAGICTCDAEFDFSGDIVGSLTGPCTAKVSCKVPADPTDPVCKAKLVLDAVGSISSPVACDAELSNLVVSGPVDSNGDFDGNAKAKLCLDCGPQHVCQGVAGDFQYEVDPPIPWQLTVEVTPDPENPNRLVGEATDDLGPFFYTAKGKYNPTTDQSTISLKGVTRKVDPESVSQGAKIKLEELSCGAGGCSDGTATFKVQGNKAKDAPVGP